MKMEQSVPKRRHIKSRRRVIAQKKAYYKRLVVLNMVNETSDTITLREFD